MKRLFSVILLLILLMGLLSIGIFAENFEKTLPNSLAIQNVLGDMTVFFRGTNGSKDGRAEASAQFRPSEKINCTKELEMLKNAQNQLEKFSK